MSPDEEVSVLIRTLRAIDERLHHLTAGEVDTVTDREGKSFLLRAAQGKLRHSEAARQAALLNALPAHVALLNADGCIVSVNAAWSRFADDNGLLRPGHEVGVNYLAVCDSACGEDSAEAEPVAAGIRAVLKGQLAHFSLEYGCHSPVARRWFMLIVTPLVADRLSGAVIMHIDVTQRRSVQDAVRRFATAMDAFGDAIFLVDRTTLSYIHVNDAACRMTGLTRTALLNRGPAIGLGMTREVLERHYDRIIAAGPESAPEPVEFQYKGKDGSPAWFEIRRHAQQSEHGWTIVILMQDVTERKLARDRIAYLNRIHAVLSGINTLIVRVRERSELFSEACRIAVDSGGFRKAWIGLIDNGTGVVAPVASAGVDDELLEGIRQLLASESGSLTGNTLTARAIRSKTAIVTNEVSSDVGIVFARQYAAAGISSAAVLPLIIADVAVGVLALYSPETGFFHAEEIALLEEMAADISFAISHIDQRSRVDYLAFYDELTGLANRTLFLDRLAQYTSSASDNGHQLAVLLLDIERFRNINDSLGRAVGDGLLKQLGAWLVESSGNASLLARVGVDHFAVIIPEVSDEQEVPRYVEQGLDSLVGHSFEFKGDTIGVTAKIGIALFPDDGSAPETLLRNAEAALKKAKASGDRYLFYNQRMTVATAGRLTLEGQLRQALDKGEFLLHYQPKINLASGLLTGAEALIRWNDPRSGLVPPGQFIPVLEETGLIYAVGRWAIRQAIADSLRWRNEGLPGVRLAVNISPLQLRDRGFIAKIWQMISVAEHAAAGLELEITESLIMEDIDQTIAVLREVQAMGITIAIDDFGTGFSSLSYLSKLAVNTIKIDRSFVSNMTAGPEGLALVSTIINLAHALKLKVVAEGVETEDQSRLLRLLNCDEMQGYLFSRPIPSEEFAARYLALPLAGGPSVGAPSVGAPSGAIL